MNCRRVHSQRMTISEGDAFRIYSPVVRRSILAETLVWHALRRFGICYTEPDPYWSEGEPPVGG